MRIEELGAHENLSFQDCKLDRKKYAEVLTDIISGFDNGGVIALNNKWGTGKTTFVKMWKHFLEEKQYQTIYFNAWENDFEDNALAALISELTDNIKREDDKLIDAAAKLATNIGIGALKILVDIILGSGASNHLKGISDVCQKHILEDDIKNYKNKKDAIKEFKCVLESFIEKNAHDSEKNANIIFFVDELDRCRPNYAVKVLEIIKHFFTVRNIIFVLSIDKEQLGYAIQGVYGSSKIDSEEYLRRFMDIEYSLPESSIRQYIVFLLDKVEIKHYFLANFQDEIIRKIYHLMQEFFHQSTLRQIEKITINLKLIIRSNPNWVNQYNVQIMIFLLSLKFNKRSLYIKYLNREIDIEKFNDFFYDIYKKLKVLKIDDFLTSYLEASLLMGYIWGDSMTLNRNLEKIKDSSENIILYESKINQELFNKAFNDVTRKHEYDSIHQTINLIELIPS